MPSLAQTDNLIPFPYRHPQGETIKDEEPMLKEYKQHVRSQTRSAATIRARGHYIDKLATAVDVTAATPAEIETWLHSHGWAPTSINSALASIRHFYRWAVRYGHLTTDPTQDIRRVREPRKVARVAGDDVILRAMMRAPVDTRVMIMLGAECGLRRAEIAKVHRNDIEGEWLYIIGKGGHQRSVCLSPELLELVDLLPPHGYLFPGHQQGHISADAVYRRIRRIVGVNTHSLRHRAGTAAFAGTGNNLRVAQEFLGHANPAMTARYVHITRGDLRRAAAATRLAA